MARPARRARQRIPQPTPDRADPSKAEGAVNPGGTLHTGNHPEEFIDWLAGLGRSGGPTTAGGEMPRSQRALVVAGPVSVPDAASGKS